MFTGIITHVGKIKEVLKNEKTISLVIEARLSGLTLGESIAVDGACLTVTAFDSDSFCVDLSSETLDRTLAGNYRINTLVNLERSLEVGSRLSGHFVLGHVDTTAIVAQVRDEEDFRYCQLKELPKGFRKYLVPKGSIAINGVSLTINSINELGAIGMMWVPHTLLVTTLRNLKTGDLVNVEFDYLAKIVTQNTVLQASS